MDLATGEEVALKHVFPQRQARGCAPAPCALARELAALQALRHPNILALRAVLPQARIAVSRRLVVVLFLAVTACWRRRGRCATSDPCALCCHKWISSAALTALLCTGGLS